MNGTGYTPRHFQVWSIVRSRGRTGFAATAFVETLPRAITNDRALEDRKERRMTSPDLPDVAGVKAYAEQLQSSFEKMLVEGPKVAAEARAMTVTKKSKDGLVTVTVSARGELETLELDPRIYRRPDSRELAESIVELTQAATAEAKEAVIAIFEKIAPRTTVERHMNGDIEGISEDMNARMMGRE